jgi:hypothetical protein
VPRAIDDGAHVESAANDEATEPAPARLRR